MTLLLVDGTNVVMRCASIASFPPDEAVQVAVNIIRRAVRTIGAEHLVVAFDASGSLRRAVYPPYKADRTTDTAPWIAKAMAALDEASIYHTRADGFEADDVIATLVSRVSGREPVAILSGDSDLLVLASETVTVWRFDKRAAGGIEPFTSEQVCEKYGIPTPQHLTLYKALVGEPGDNVPGVPNIGVVRARKLIAEFGELHLMRKLDVLGQHAEWAEKAWTLLSLYTFASIEPISRALSRTDHLVSTRKSA